MWVSVCTFPALVLLMTLLGFRCECRVCWRLLNLCECATLMHIPDWYISMETCSTLYKPVAKEWALASFFFLPFLYHFFPSHSLCLSHSLSLSHTRTLVLLQQRDPAIALELSQCKCPPTFMMRFKGWKKFGGYVELVQGWRERLGGTERKVEGDRGT